MGAPTNAFIAEYGTKQGRIEVAGAPAGSFVFQLGHADAGVKRRIASGDTHRIEASFDMTGIQKIRCQTKIRAAELPAGWTWLFTALIDGVPFFNWIIDRSVSTNDAAVLPGVFLLGGTTFPMQFRLLATAPNPTDIEDIELPGIEIDALIEDVVTRPFDVFARLPMSGDEGVPLNATLRMSVAKRDAPFDLVPADIDVFVDGQQVVVAGVGQAGWLTGFDVHGWGVILTMDHITEFAPLSNVNVQVLVRGTESFAWSFTTADTIAPIVESAFAPTPTTVRVVFDEPVDEATATDASHYTLALLGGAPAVVPGVVSVEFEAPRVAVLTLATMMTRGALYRVTVTDVTDVFGNIVASPNDSAEFVGYRWPVPAGRRTKLFEYLPEAVRAKDETGEHERFLGVMQELFDVYYGLADRALDIIDPDFAPIEAVDNMLLDLGNPFDFLELTETEKRILAQTLLAIYKTKGTGPGIVNALRFFIGIETSIRVYAWAPYGIGEAIIGETLVLGSSNQADLYTFELVVTDFLTDTERKNLTVIVDYMKVAHEHWRLIEPEVPVVFDHWQLGFSLLDTQTILHSP